MSNRFLTASLALITLTTGTLAAQQTYASVYQIRKGGYGLLVGETQAQCVSRLSATFKQGLRVTDLEVYRDARGTIRYDTVYDAGTGAQWVHFGVDQKGLIAAHNLRAKQGLRITDLCSYYTNSGQRRWTVVFRPVSASAFYLGQTQAQMIATWKSLSPKNLRIAVMESYLDHSGNRLYDTVYHPRSGGHYLWLGLTATQFLQKDQDARKVRLNMLTFEKYYDAAGTLRYNGVWAAGLPTSRVILNETQSKFLATWKYLSGTIWRLYDVESRIRGAAPFSRNYGIGLKGRNSIPSLKLGRLPWTGQKNTVDMGNSSGVPSASMLILGVRSTSIPFLGGRLNVVPLTTATLVVGSTGTRLPVFVPNDPTLNGVYLYAQLMQKDAKAPAGVSMSQGLQMRFGRRD